MNRIIDLPNPFESAPEAGRPAGAAFSSSPARAAPVGTSSPEVEATSAPGMAHLESLAKATRGNAGMAGVTGPVRRSTAGTGLRVGEASADLPTTSEFMDVTAGETAPNSNSGRAVGPCSGIKCGVDRTQSCLRDNGQASNDADVSVVTAGETAPNSGMHRAGRTTASPNNAMAAENARETIPARPEGASVRHVGSGESPETNSDVIDIPAFLQRNPDNTFRFPSA